MIIGLMFWFVFAPCASVPLWLEALSVAAEPGCVDLSCFCPAGAQATACHTCTCHTVASVTVTVPSS